MELPSLILKFCSSVESGWVEFTETYLIIIVWIDSVHIVSNSVHTALNQPLGQSIICRSSA
jgi:hypothetical protein